MHPNRIVVPLDGSALAESVPPHVIGLASAPIKEGGHGTLRVHPDKSNPRSPLLRTNFDTTAHHNPSQAITRHPRSVGMCASKISASGLGILGFGGAKKWWTGGELNSRHRDFQSRARERAVGPRRTRCPPA
jgi:hypothetical protein